MPKYKVTQVFEYTDEFEIEAVNLFEAKRMMDFTDFTMKADGYKLKSTKILDPGSNNGIYFEKLTSQIKE